MWGYHLEDTKTMVLELPRTEKHIRAEAVGYCHYSTVGTEHLYGNFLIPATFL